MRVKWYHFILLAGTADAALLANFQTSRGTVVIDLQYTKAPQTVANFITLAQGTRSWVDPVSGERFGTIEVPAGPRPMRAGVVARDPGPVTTAALFG
jgi:hypothetical protein